LDRGASSLAFNASRCTHTAMRGPNVPRVAGCPESFAQEALAPNSKAIHRANAKRALMKTPSLEDYEQRAAAQEDPARKMRDNTQQETRRRK